MSNKNEMREKISVVVPCYNEEAALPYFFSEIRKVADKMSADDSLLFEFLFVNDGSKDKTLELLYSFSKQDERARYLSFSRNFGKEAALFAGLEHAQGDYVAVMDADMQDPPTLLPEMFEALKGDEYDSVATRRVDRKGEPPIRSFFARCFYKIKPDIRRRYRGWGPGFPVDETKNGGGYPLHAGVQSLLQRNFRLGGVSN